jgi:hypothetical protein
MRRGSAVRESRRFTGNARGGHRAPGHHSTSARQTGGAVGIALVGGLAPSAGTWVVAYGYAVIAAPAGGPGQSS